MLLLYKILYTACLPLLALASLLRSKYRGRLLERLGLGSSLQAARLSAGPVVWFHALSVGEVRSAVSLLMALREEIPRLHLVMTVSTRSGRKLAESLLGSHLDLLLYSPLDVSFALRRFIAAIQPQVFILVETDFWPNWLDQLDQRNIPSLLVNGRISTQAFASYRRFACFFRPMFQCFTLLTMQTQEDRDKLLALGIPAARLAVLGNLKYEIPSQQKAPVDLKAAYQGRWVWVCGSTHPGEEELLFTVFKEIRQQGIELSLLLAPRQITRSKQLLQMARQLGLAAELRSSFNSKAISNVLIADSIGELAACYGLARLAFIGGSLVDQGGHNPIEAAVQGIPVLFGPHMEDFSEIAQALLASGGGEQVTAATLREQITALLTEPQHHARMSQAARNLVAEQQGSLQGHVRHIKTFLEMRKE
jgi:3-deoxy-D-manno-octulosonic-acid transferase